MTLKMALFAPMPDASVNNVTAVKSGARVSRRATWT